MSPGASGALGLAFLAADILAEVTDTLALVGLGGLCGPDFRGVLTHLLLVGTADGDTGKLFLASATLDG